MSAGGQGGSTSTGNTVCCGGAFSVGGTSDLHAGAVSFRLITDVQDCFFLIMLQALREFKEQKICQEQFTNAGYLGTRLLRRQQI